MWRAFRDVRHIETPAINGETKFLRLSLRQRCGHPPPSSGPGLPVMGAARTECRPSRLLGRQDQDMNPPSHNPIVMSANDPTDPWLDGISNCKRLEEHRYSESLAVGALFMNDDPPLWSGLLSPPARAASLRETREFCLNRHEDTHFFRNCMHLFINASGCLNPELTQHGDDDAF